MVIVYWFNIGYFLNYIFHDMFTGEEQILTITGY